MKSKYVSWRVCFIAICMISVLSLSGYSEDRQQGDTTMRMPQDRHSSSSPPRKEWVAQAIELAREARKRSYAPYSKFRMGAVVGTDTGQLVPGALVENVSLGLSMCAERVALFSSVVQEAGRPNLLVLVAPRTNRHVTFPCGACLQVATELGGPDLHVVACDLKGQCEGSRVADLAPRLPHKR